MKNGFLNFLIIVTFFLICFNFTSALIISDVHQGKFFPGEQTSLDITIQNNLDEDVNDVSFNLIFENLPFIPIGSSEISYSEIREGKSRSFNIAIKSSQNIKPGNYNLPYSLSYNYGENKVIKKSGSIGIVVDGNTELDLNIESKNNVVGEKGTISMKIVNKGFSDVKFTSLKIIPHGFLIFGSDSSYIGTIESDDFETASFDVLFKNENANVEAVITYKDFNNNDKVENISIPLKVYTRQEALEIGIIKKNRVFLLVGVLSILIVLIIIYRKIKKTFKKKQKS
ncbi:MAG: hypothetical protein QW727_03615 [Candidatus Pacearchaeota archaeon]